MIVVGTAGWSIPRAAASSFPGPGTHLERYARVLGGTEINSSFYRPHASAVYSRWAASTPESFRFSVKLPRSITHEARLRRVGPLLDAFLAEVAGLGAKLGPILVQLPPSLEFEAATARRFFRLLRKRHAGSVVCEPRHVSWTSGAADTLLGENLVGRVIADPPRPRAHQELRGAAGHAGALAYYRLHGWPRMYWSRYSLDRIEAWAEQVRALAAATTDVWCTFDNTASGAAAQNAVELLGTLQSRPASEDAMSNAGLPERLSSAQRRSPRGRRDP